MCVHTLLPGCAHACSDGRGLTRGTQDSYFTSVKLGGFFVVLLQLDVAVAQATVYVTARSNITEFLKPVTDVVEAVLRG
jgi:hypothetical protein